MATPQKTASRGAPPAKTANKPTPPQQKPTQPAREAAKPTPPAQQQGRPPATPANKPVTAGGGDGPARSTAVAERQTTAVAAKADVPEYLRQSVGRGSENVEMQDMVIPRIELVQALSKCLEEGSGEYIEGAKAGMFYNSVTRELYGHSVTVCPVFFKKQYLAWRDRKTTTGGFGGAFDSAQECHERIAQEEDADSWEAVDTAQQIVLVVNTDTWETSEAVLSCARTKMKISRQWNSLIRVNGFDRFSRLYELFSTDEQNAKGDRYKNIAIRYVDFAPMEVYKAAEALYNSIASGAITVKIDDSYIDGASGEVVGDGVPGGQADDPGASTEY